MLRKDHFASMKPESAFINTARGEIVNEPELVEVLQERPDIFAVLDVTNPEPPIPDSPILTLPNAILTPHLAVSLSQECIAMGRSMVNEFKRYIAGERLKWEVRQTDLDRIA